MGVWLPSHCWSDLPARNPEPETGNRRDAVLAFQPSETGNREPIRGGAVRAERYKGNGPRVPHSKIAQFAILEWGCCATSADDGRYVLSFLVGCPTLPAFLREGGDFDFRPYSIDETESSSSSSTEAAKPAPRNPIRSRAGSMLMSNAIFSSSQR